MAHVTFIHGIANKPAPDVLIASWERALAEDDGLDLGSEGISTSMVYWADVLYPDHKEGTFESVDEAAVDGPDEEWTAGMEAGELDWVRAVERRLEIPAVSEVGPEADSGLERIMLPDLIKRPLMRTLLRDVHHYLFNVTHQPRPEEEYRVCDEIRRRTIETLRKGAGEPGPHIVVCHSMGTVIAYDCLKRVDDCPSIDGLMTIGSPLGLDEIPSRLRPAWSRSDGFPADRLRGTWVNVFDHFDPVVGPTPHLTFRYKHRGVEAVVDVNEQNWGRWRHDISKYLRGSKLRESLAGLLEG